MRKALVVVLVMTAAAMAGCSAPQRISVRADGVMALVADKKALIYDDARGTVQPLRVPDGEGKRESFWVEWSPDGNKLAVMSAFFYENDKVYDAEVLIFDGKGQFLRKLLLEKVRGNDDTQPSPFLPGHWNRDGTRFSFTYVTTDRHVDLKAIDIESGKITTLMNRIAIWHAWDPKGDRVAAFQVTNAMDEGGFATLVVAEPGGKEKALAWLMLKSLPWLTWSKDGQRILFCASKATAAFPLLDEPDPQEPDRRLFEVNLKTEHSRQLSDRQIGYAEYSPDGKRILFVEMMDAGKTRVGVMSADGTGVAELDDGVSGGAWIFGPATFQPVWLSNSRVQYYKGELSRDKTYTEIWAIDIDGKNKENLGAKTPKLVDALPNDGPKAPQPAERKDAPE